MAEFTDAMSEPAAAYRLEHAWEQDKRAPCEERSRDFPLTHTQLTQEPLRDRSFQVKSQNANDRRDERQRCKDIDQSKFKSLLDKVKTDTDRIYNHEHNACIRKEEVVCSVNLHMYIDLRFLATLHHSPFNDRQPRITIINDPLYPKRCGPYFALIWLEVGRAKKALWLNVIG
jgi:hypothetical protein